MKRSICCLAILAVIAIPDWASACWPLWGPHIYQAPQYAPVPLYSVPVYPPAYYYTPVYQPAPLLIYQPQQLLPGLRMAQPSSMTPSVSAPFKPPVTNSTRIPSSPQTAPSPREAPTKPGAMPLRVDQLRPPADSESVIPPLRPINKIEPPTGSAEIGSLPKSPQGEKSNPLPSLVIPNLKEHGTAPKIEANEVPKKASPAAVPTTAPADPLSLLPDSTMKIPSPQLAIPGATLPAVPSAAPALSEPLIPLPASPFVPINGKSDSLPPLSLPPEVSPKANPESISRSSPITGNREMKVEVFPSVSADKAQTPYASVTYFNHTNRELDLTIEGRQVKLPAKTYLEAKLAQSFTWSQGERPATREAVPAGASGLDIVFRD